MKYVSLLELLNKLLEGLLWLIGYVFARKHDTNPVFTSLYHQVKKGWVAGLSDQKQLAPAS